MNRVQRDGDLVIGLACGLALMAAGAAACRLRGFFFAGEMYPFLTLWFALCAGMAMVILVLYTAARRAGAGGMPVISGSAVTGPAAKRLQGSSGNVQGLFWDNGQRSITRAAVMLLPGCSLGILTLYGIHALRGCLSSQGTLNELLRWGLYASFALLALCAAGTRRGRYILAAVWHFLGITISLSALLAVCGGLPLPYAVAYSQSPEVSATGARLAGLLQYPNTFGAVMAVFLLERLFAAAYGLEREAAGGAESAAASAAAWISALRLLPLFPYAAALLLSESRGAWLAAAAACAAALLWKRQLCAPLLLAGAAPVAGAAILYRQLARTGLAVMPLPGLLLLAGLWAGALLAGLWVHRRGSSAAGGRAAMLALAAAGWTAAGSAVLMHVRARITGPSPTAGARGLMYRDAWKLAAEAPWLGRGGETWRQSYLAAQSRPYVGSQVHSGYLDILLNLGIAGVAAVLLLLLAASWLISKASPRLLPPLLVIVLHSAADFDWSYGLMWLLLFLLPAWALAEAKHGSGPAVIITSIDTSISAATACVHPTFAGITTAEITRQPEVTIPVTALIAAPSVLITNTAITDFPAASITAQTSGPPACLRSQEIPVPGYLSCTRQASWRRLLLPMRAWRMYAGITLASLLACTFSLLSFQALSGTVLYKQAAGVPEPAAQAVLLRQSLAWNPRDPQTAVALSRLLPLEQGNILLLNALKYSPGNAALHWELAERDLNGSNPGAALYQVRLSLKLDVFNTAKRLAAIEGMLEQSRRGLAAGDWRKAADSAAAGLELLRQYSLLAASETRKGQQHNDRGFELKQEAEGMGLRLRNVLAVALRNEIEGDS